MTAVINELSLEQLIDLAKEVVAEAGEDYIYPREHRRVVQGFEDFEDGPTQCVYVHDGQPDCIVGRILAKAGAPVGELEKYEGKDAFGVYAELTAGVDKRDLGFNGPIATFLSELQGSQDIGHAWGESLENALDALASRGYVVA